MIDATSPVTKYYQLKDILVKNIQDGKWPPQSRMSSENELCEAYNVSRVTVRKAIDLLVQEGYVYTIKGKGTYVKGKYIEQPLTHFYSFREDLRSRGVSTYSTMRHFDIVPADARLAADLNIRQDDNVFCIERIFFAGEQPYPTLSEVAKDQREFHFANTYGTVIAVWCPRYVNGINLPGWHFHYLSGDKTQGGHILGLSADHLTLKINQIERFDLTLPRNPEFAQRDLCEDLSAKTAAVEGVKK